MPTSDPMTSQPSAPLRLTWTDPPLAVIPTPSGAMTLTRSLASGLVRRASDPPGVFWGVGDRGPNIKPKDAMARYGLTGLASLAGIDGARVMPLPGGGPALARFRLTGDQIVLEAAMPLKAMDGSPLTGVPPTPLSGMESEPAFSLDGEPLPPSSLGADTEGIAALPDGRFWIADEYGPSLLLAREDGVVERRLIPMGGMAMFEGSPVPVVEALPALALARKLNRGFEGVTLSADGAVLYVAFQSPLAHPDRTAHDEGQIVRLWALDPLSGALIGEHAYQLDPPESFVRDIEAGPVERSDIKVSELTALPDGGLLVLERVTHSTHIYRVRPGPETALSPIWSDPEHRPTLEQAGQDGFAILDKELVLSTDVETAICGDLEGMILIGPHDLLLASDSDYGIEGGETEFWQVRLG
ncbi:MAG: hypothetical protein CFE28_10590 [Alphaproteobacteria bacterium PA2]|nr:MAG: hypothetical protein CFE28_10590 [Alphaproteobacteria bacterium PA2]